MYSDETEKTARSWASSALPLMRKLLPLMSPVGKSSLWTPEERQTLGYLLSACARSTESALLLIAYGQLWDTEVLLRSVTEGSLKFCYLLQNPSTFKQRHQEYSHDLWRISLLKDHNKAEELLAALPHPLDPQWRPIHERLLSESGYEEIRQTYDRSQRRLLDTKWGFAGVVGELTRSGDPLFAGFAGLFHNYSLASHIHHADYLGTSLPMDRDRRSDSRRNTLHLAHVARLLTDGFTFLRLRLEVAYRFLGTDRKPITDIWPEVESFETALGVAYVNWMAVEYPSEVEPP